MLFNAVNIMVQILTEFQSTILNSSKFSSYLIVIEFVGRRWLFQISTRNYWLLFAPTTMQCYFVVQTLVVAPENLQYCPSEFRIILFVCV